jgi:hypothetical protein
VTARRKDVPVFGAEYEQVIEAAQEGRSTPPARAIDHYLFLAIGHLYRAGELTGGGVEEVSAGTAPQFDIERLAEGLRPKLAALKAGTELWYAATTVVCFAHIHAALDRNDHYAAIDIAFDLGGFAREWGVQQKYGVAIDVHGEHTARIREEASKNKQRAKQWAAEMQAEAEKRWARDPTLSRRRVAEFIAKSKGGNPDTIRKAIRQPKK